jgi:hypothetical protein
MSIFQYEHSSLRAAPIVAIIALLGALATITLGIRPAVWLLCLNMVLGVVFFILTYVYWRLGRPTWLYFVNNLCLLAGGLALLRLYDVSGAAAVAQISSMFAFTYFGLLASLRWRARPDLLPEGRFKAGE